MTWTSKNDLHQRTFPQEAVDIVEDMGRHP